MTNYIDRQTIIDTIHRAIYPYFCGAEDGDALSEDEKLVLSVNKAVCTAIKALPSADVQPVRHGHWYHGEAYPHHLYCSVCYRTALPNDEYVERWGLHMNYCPNCGARMDGEHDG